jgi:hypothetical protein
MGWTIGVLGFDFRRGLGIFLFTTVSRTALWPTQPLIQWVPGALSLGVKRPGGEADHSHPSSTEVKNEWSYTFTPQYVFMAWCLVKHRDNFTFTILPLSALIQYLDIHHYEAPSCTTTSHQKNCNGYYRFRRSLFNYFPGRKLFPQPPSPYHVSTSHKNWGNWVTWRYGLLCCRLISLLAGNVFNEGDQHGSDGQPNEK